MSGIECGNIKNPKGVKKQKIEIYENPVQSAYDNTLYMLCMICAGLITAILVITGWILWDEWYELLECCVAHTGFIFMGLVKLMNFYIKKSH